MGQEPQRQVERYADEVEHYRRMVDNTKSFTTPAIITLVLYFVFWIPGFIANIVYYNEANSIQKRTGREPEGKGCLLALLIVFGGLVGLGFCALVLIIGGALSS